MSYPPIFVIALERTPERTLRIKRQLDALNLNYQLVYGIDKHNLSSAEYKLKIARQFGISKSNKHIYANPNYGNGLAPLLSHVKAYDLIIKNKIPIACILEDDANILPSFPKVLAGALKLEWDILMLSNQSAAGKHLVNIFIEYLRPRLKIFKLFPELINYHKNYPKLPTVHRTKVTVQCMLDIIIRQYLSYRTLRKETINLSSMSPINRVCTTEYYGCKMGALAIRNKQHKVVYNHYMAMPLERPASCMAYMLTLSAATKWKSEAMSDHSKHIDHIPWKLFMHDGVKVYVLLPPCVDATQVYMRYSTRRF